MGKKYGFTGKTKVFCDIKLKQIVALKDFGDIKKGDIGGWIQNQNNLEHKGDCWITKEAMAFNNSRVSENALVTDQAMLSHSAKIKNNASIGDKARADCYALIKDNAKVYDSAYITELADLKGNCTVLGYSWIGGRATIGGNAKIKGRYYSCISGTTSILGFTELEGEFDIQNASISNSHHDRKLDLYPLVMLNRDYCPIILDNKLHMINNKPCNIREFIHDTTDSYDYGIKDSSTLKEGSMKHFTNEYLIKAKKFWTNYKKLVLEYELENKISYINT